MHPAFEIGAKVRAYLRREVRLQELGGWFDSAMGPLLALPGDLPAARLATAIQLGFLEMRGGALSERGFRSLLGREFTGTTEFTLVDNPALVLSESTTTTTSVTLDDSSGEASTDYQEIRVDIVA